MNKNTILYVDDDLDDRVVFSEVIAEVNPAIQCLLAPDAYEALRILETNKELLLCVYVDVNMPLMNGLELLEKIRSDQRFDSIPIIILSTSKNPIAEERAVLLGAAEYVVKPNTYTGLAEILKDCTKYH